MLRTITFIISKDHINKFCILVVYYICLMLKECNYNLVNMEVNVKKLRFYSIRMMYWQNNSVKRFFTVLLHEDRSLLVSERLFLYLNLNSAVFVQPNNYNWSWCIANLSHTYQPYTSFIPHSNSGNSILYEMNITS